MCEDHCGISVAYASTRKSTHAHTQTCVRRRARPSPGGNSDHLRFSERSQAVATSPLTVTPLFFPSARHILQRFSYRPTPVMQTFPLVYQPGGDLRSAQLICHTRRGPWNERRVTHWCLSKWDYTVMLPKFLFEYPASFGGNAGVASIVHSWRLHFPSFHFVVKSKGLKDVRDSFEF